ncbi:hypothetical protein DW732_00665 [Collinsella sp. AM28-11LB]|nr:hypothetical protein DW732_00665 [Collinsella sp. AM28-11LB]
MRALASSSVCGMLGAAPWWPKGLPAPGLDSQGAAGASSLARADVATAGAAAEAAGLGAGTAAGTSNGGRSSPLVSPAKPPTMASS